MYVLENLYSYNALEVREFLMFYRYDCNDKYSYLRRYISIGLLFRVFRNNST